MGACVYVEFFAVSLLFLFFFLKTWSHYVALATLKYVDQGFSACKDHHCLLLTASNKACVEMRLARAALDSADHRACPAEVLVSCTCTKCVFSLKFFLKTCVHVFAYVYVCIHDVCASSPKRSEESVESPGTRITSACMPPCG